MNKKMCLSVVSAFISLALLVGCGGDKSKKTASSGATSTDTASSQAVSAEEKGITLNGTDLNEYIIVYDEDDAFSQYAAEIFASELEAVTNIKLDFVGDSVEEQKNELLIGKTNREASSVKFKTKSDEFVLATVEDKVVMLANGYMIGGAANELLEICESAVAEKKSAEIVVQEDITPIKYEFEEAKNAILMIGDGMGHNHIEAAKKEGMTAFYAESMPNVGSAVTYSYSVKPLGTAAFTDSAAAGTALATGYKTINGYVGLDHTAEIVPNVRELAFENGAKTAILTTDAITGATPGAFLAHCSDRNNTSAIQSQIDSLFLLNKITVAEGSLDESLLEKEKSALAAISSENSNFFMMLEEGYIDKKSHSNDYDGMVHTVKRFNDTIGYAMQFTLMHPDTVLIVTADHETGALTKEADGSFAFKSTDHTNTDVPLFAMGNGTYVLTKKPCNNIDVAKFIAKIYGENNFGGQG